MAETINDGLDVARAAALYTTLGLTRDAAGPLIPFGHQIYFWNPAPEQALGRDGHTRKGGLIPDTGLPRRMWAGGRLQFHAPLRPGKPATKSTHLEGVTRKQGSSGPLAFATLRHEITQGDTQVVTEWQDLVFREDPVAGAPVAAPRLAPTDAETVETHSFSTTLLFRYSALTFNGHRIHYDLEYCRDVEGYPGIIVHGPLLAQLLMLMAERQLGHLSRFSFRATAPLFHTETARFCSNGGRFWVAGPDGRLCMEAEAS